MAMTIPKQPGPTSTRAFDLPSKSAQEQALAKRILTGLYELYPDAHCELNSRSSHELLIATILSAQATDVSVNKAAPKLFKQFPNARAYAKSTPKNIEPYINSIGLFRNKAKSIHAAMTMIVEDFGGEVPDTMEDLLKLRGVARKTANVVLGNAFGKNEGVVVDTHVGRIAERLALTWSGKNSKDAVKIEKDLMELIPRKEWTFFSHALIWHGRKVCSARKPDCESCELAELCPSAFEEDGSSSSPKKKAKSTKRRAAR